MYSRYLPDGRGGHERQPVTRAVPDPPGPEPPPHGGAPPAPDPPGGLHPPPRRPAGHPPRPAGLGGLLGNLGGILRGLDTEDYLILAILLLCRKQDGAGSAELLIAAALYLMMG